MGFFKASSVQLKHPEEVYLLRERRSSCILVSPTRLNNKMKCSSCELMGFVNSWKGNSVLDMCKEYVLTKLRERLAYVESCTYGQPSLFHPKYEEWVAMDKEYYVLVKKIEVLEK